MKNLYTLLLCTLAFFMGIHVNAQTIVSTSPANKNVVLEEFTGIYCTYCPDGHKIAQQIKDANASRVVLVNVKFHKVVV